MKQIEHIKYMKRALQLAGKASGRTLPNPMVGAVIVKKNKIIGQGYHDRFGANHAEVEALDAAGTDANGSTLYVSLEPCSHYGKTPPCVDRIIASGINQVVIAMQDPNELVNGTGIQKLRDHHITVITGVCETEARRLNQPFIKYITSNLPYVTLKLAETLDGKIADIYGKSKWISSEYARQMVQDLRRAAGAVAVGINTVILDNPHLTFRNKKNVLQPWRIVFDSDIRIPLSSHLICDEHRSKTIIISGFAQKLSDKCKKLKQQGVTIIFCNTNSTGIDLAEALQKLAKLKIAHILVEGGSQLASAMLRENLVDELITFIAPKIFGTGMSSIRLDGFSAEQPLAFKQSKFEMCSEDVVHRGILHEY